MINNEPTDSQLFDLEVWLDTQRKCPLDFMPVPPHILDTIEALLKANKEVEKIDLEIWQEEYDRGYDGGVEAGYENGYEAGYGVGYTDGCDEGYAACKADISRIDKESELEKK